jgi:hypothetical protein
VTDPTSKDQPPRSQIVESVKDFAAKSRSTGVGCRFEGRMWLAVRDDFRNWLIQVG